jgi:hypothetical protein
MARDPNHFAKPQKYGLFEVTSGCGGMGPWRAEADETENYTYAIALQNDN